MKSILANISIPLFSKIFDIWSCEVANLFLCDADRQVHPYGPKYVVYPRPGGYYQTAALVYSLWCIHLERV